MPHVLALLKIFQRWWKYVFKTGPHYIKGPNFAIRKVKRNKFVWSHFLWAQTFWMVLKSIIKINKSKAKKEDPPYFLHSAINQNKNSKHKLLLLQANYTGVKFEMLSNFLLQRKCFIRKYVTDFTTVCCWYITSCLLIWIFQG